MLESPRGQVELCGVCTNREDKSQTHCEMRTESDKSFSGDEEDGCIANHPNLTIFNGYIT
jgi:hypothetical protein